MPLPAVSIRYDALYVACWLSHAAPCLAAPTRMPVVVYWLMWRYDPPSPYLALDKWHLRGRLGWPAALVSWPTEQR
jgi:hypothetical protein